MSSCTIAFKTPLTSVEHPDPIKTRSYKMGVVLEGTDGVEHEAVAFAYHEGAEPPVDVVVEALAAFGHNGGKDDAQLEFLQFLPYPGDPDNVNYLTHMPDFTPQTMHVVGTVTATNNTRKAFTISGTNWIGGRNVPFSVECWMADTKRWEKVKIPANRSSAYVIGKLSGRDRDNEGIFRVEVQNLTYLQRAGGAAETGSSAAKSSSSPAKESWRATREAARGRTEAASKDDEEDNEVEVATTPPANAVPGPSHTKRARKAAPATPRKRPASRAASKADKGKGKANGIVTLLATEASDGEGNSGGDDEEDDDGEDLRDFVVPDE